MLTVPLLIPSLGVPELIIILILVMMFFGVGKLPEIGAALGKGLKSFKDGQKDLPTGDGLEVSPAEIEDADET